MSFRERVRKLLKGRLPSQAQASTRSEDPGPSPASSHPEPPTIKVMASSEESATPITNDVGPSQIREEETRYAHGSTPASSQITHFSQPGPLLRSSHLESPIIVATAPSGQPAIPLIEGPEPYLGSTGQLSGAASISSLVDAWREETLYGPLEVPTWIASQVGSRSSSGQGHPPQTLNGGVLSGAHNFSVGQMNAVETQSIGIQSVGAQNVAAQYQLYMGTNCE
ncbi:hypothetical protein P691DRAFT_412934 [Macrolepiota fuliginosa MF-IS2]|uniref:Uncharacterized protein n=1 Tax=Macrolepiota fuliginosa MF-IS2 TaxID=1400762 RepID=A0A9P5X4Y2_9AGAR|nr:hypothetical protein P691DRAFT_412934 [Macrolepiota fuliginosa MF-IS2]